MAKEKKELITKILKWRPEFSFKDLKKMDMLSLKIIANDL
jgi:hypothetical protein